MQRNNNRTWPMQYLTNPWSWITLKLTFSQQFGWQLIVEMLQPDGDPHWSTESIWNYQEKALCAFSDSTSKVEVRKAKKANNLSGNIILTYELPRVWMSLMLSDLSCNFPGMALTGSSSPWALLCPAVWDGHAHSHKILKVKREESWVFLKDCFLLVGQYPREVLPPNQQYPLNNKAILPQKQSLQKAIKLSTGHKSGTLKQYKQQ